MSNELVDLVGSIEAAEGSPKLSIKGVNFDTGKVFSHNADHPLESASIIKVCFAYQFLRDHWDNLTDEVVIDAARHSEITGKGLLHLLPSGSVFRYDELLLLMMMISDNLSTNFVVDFLGGIEGVNRFIKEDLRLENSRLVQRISTKLLDGGQFGWMTAEDLFSFYETVLNSEEKIQDKFFYYMSKAKDFSMARLGRYLPIEGFYEVAQPEISYYGSKGGTFPRYNMTHDTAFIRTVQGHSIGIAVFTEGIVDTEGRYSYHVDHEPILAIAQLGKLLYQYLK